MAANKKMTGGSVGKKAVNNGKSAARTPAGSIEKKLTLNKLQSFGVDAPLKVASKKAMTTK